MKNKKNNAHLPAIAYGAVLLLIFFFPYSPALAQMNEESTPEVGISDIQEPAQADEAGPPGSEDLRKRLEALESELKDLREQVDVRKKLEPTADEKAAEEKEILSAAGREYTLLPVNTFSVEYTFAYSYFSYDIIRESLEVEQWAKHSVTNSLFLEYAIRDNLTLNLSLPFAYKYDERLVSGKIEDIDVTDIGDISLGLQYQPFTLTEALPTMNFSGKIILPTGRSPYDINTETELSTGNGYYSASVGTSLSKRYDPVVIYGSLGYTYKHEESGIGQNRPAANGGTVVLEKVEPGDSISASVGFGLALSYNFSINFSYAFSYGLESKYYWEGERETESGTSTGSTLGIGCGFRFSSGRSIYTSLSIGLTNDDSDFGISVRVPFEFLLN